MTDRIVIDTSEAGNDQSGAPRVPRGAGLIAIIGLGLAAWLTIGSLGADEPPESGQLTIPTQPFEIPSGTWIETTFSVDGSFTDVALGDGRLVAVGSGRRVDSAPFAWISTDGMSWTAASGEWSTGDVLTAVLARDGGFLAAGYRLLDPPKTAAEPRLWASDDGAVWEQVDTVGVPNRGVIVDMALTDSAIVAIGWEGPAVLEPLQAPGSDTVARVWTSVDGATWTDRTPAGSGLRFAATTGDAIAGSVEGRPAIWVDAGAGWMAHPGPEQDDDRVAIALTARGDRLVTVVRPGNDVEGVAGVWLVDPSGAWQRLDHTGSPTATGWIAPIAGGFFAGSGYTRSIYPSGPELWVSEGGSSWTGVDVTAGQSPWPPATVTSVTSLDGRLLAFGSRGGAPSSWTLDG